MVFSKTLKEKRLVVQCDSCFRDITALPFIRCADCVWDQCLSCFLCGEVGGKHSHTHSFRLIRGLFSPLFNEKWRIIDELLLVNGIVSFGIGNFEDIATFLSSLEAEDVKIHFYEIAEIKNSTEGEAREEQGVAGQLVFKSEPNDTEVLSFLPKRKEFDSELWNEYETLIEDLQFSEADTAADKTLKKYILSYYRVILRQRAMWRNMLIDRNLVAVNRIRSHDGTTLGVLAGKWKWLLPFLSKNDFNSFIDGLLRQRVLKEQLSRSSMGKLVDEKRLFNMSELLSEKEKELCGRLNMSHKLYVRLKRFSLECFMAKKPLRNAMLKLFNPEDHERVDVLYRWFSRQNIVHKENEDAS